MTADPTLFSKSPGFYQAGFYLMAALTTRANKSHSEGMHITKMKIIPLAGADI